MQDEPVELSNKATYLEIEFEIIGNHSHGLREVFRDYWDMVYKDPAGGIIVLMTGFFIMLAGWIGGYCYYLIEEMFANFGVDENGDKNNGFPNPYVN